MEKQLIRDLLITYDEVTPHGRPVVNDNTTVDVRFGIGLIQLELDEQQKLLSLSLWLKYVSETKCCPLSEQSGWLNWVKKF